MLRSQIIRRRWISPALVCFSYFIFHIIIIVVIIIIIIVDVVLQRVIKERPYHARAFQCMYLQRLSVALLFVRAESAGAQCNPRWRIKRYKKRTDKKNNNNNNHNFFFFFIVTSFFDEAQSLVRVYVSLSRMQFLRVYSLVSSIVFYTTRRTVMFYQ